MSSAKTQLANERSLKKLFALTVAALGVVYGDIGTSPLYAINQIFFANQQNFNSSNEILGCISLVVWALSSIICFKYLTLILKADNDGEGGIFALYSKLHKYKFTSISYLKVCLMLAAGLLIGSSIITPAISVLSAVEGLTFIAPNFQSKVVPITACILILVFSIQYRGSSIVGKFYGPVAFIWFITIGSLGFYQVVLHPEILQALNPVYGFQFLFHASIKQILSCIGALVLVVTGGEALFADMGHFGKAPIRIGWYSLVYPALLLNYLGQGALLLSQSPITNQNVFYSLVPNDFLPYMIILSTIAAIIASQAMISGAFSLTYQAIALGLFPRLKTTHTHEEHAGQIYLGFINWMLCFFAILLVVTFKHSHELAAAYGLSVASAMFVSSIAMIAIAYFDWQWHPVKAILIFGWFAIVDFGFLISNVINFFEGGFIPFIIGFLIFSIMRIWRWGRKSTYAAYNAHTTMRMKDVIALKENNDEAIDRCVVLMAQKSLHSEEEFVPALLQFFINRYGILPKHLFLIEVLHQKVPYIHGQRHENFTLYKDPKKGSINSVQIKFGFMEEPNVEKALEELAIHHQISLPSDPHKWLVHVSHERLVPPRNLRGLRLLRFRLFLIFRQMTQPAYFYYGLGTDVNLSLDIMPIKIK